MIAKLLIFLLYFLFCNCYLYIFITVITNENKTKLRRSYLTATIFPVISAFLLGASAVANVQAISQGFWAVGFITGCFFYPGWLNFLLNMVELKRSKVITYIFKSLFPITLILAVLCVRSNDVIASLAEYGSYHFSFKGSLIFGIIVAYNVTLIGIIFMLHILWWHKSKLKYMRKLTFIYMVLLTITAPFGIATNYLIPLFTDYKILPIASVLLLPAYMYLFLSMRKNKSFSFTVSNVSGYIFNSVALPVLALNHENEICLGNKAANNFFGGNFTGKNIAEIILIDGEMPEQSFFKDNFENKPAIVVTTSGKKICNIMLAMEKDKYGDALCKVILFRDMTEIQNASVRLEKALVQANAANITKNRFLASMSHEIRTPMNVIIGIAQIQLSKGNLTEDYEAALKRIYNSGGILLGIINDILDLSKIETGKMELNPTLYDMPSLVHDAVQLNIVRIESKPIEFKLDIDENLPSKLIGDELRIKQILNNLLSNAIKYTKEGYVKLSIKHTASGKNVSLCFIVEDKGQGMKPEDVNKLFSEYIRFNLESNLATEGTGIGLNITKNLVELMEGTITAESTYGKGSVFTVTIMQKAVECEAIGAELSQRLRNFTFSGEKQLAGLQIMRYPMPYGKVLVVDDVETNLFVAEGLLSPYKINIETVLSGFAAIEKVQAGNVYDVIFMDHMMPQMDGMEATKRLREMNYKGVIVALTANAIAGNAEMFKQNGFDDFIAKPIDARHLNDILDKYIRKNHPEEAQKYKPEMTGETASSKINPKMLEVFRRDAEKAIKTLRETAASGDIKLYTTTAHAMKSALANVGESQKSKVALLLEEAGIKGDWTYINANTENFAQMLEQLVKELTPQESENPDNEIQEDAVYLAEQMIKIKAVCEDYDDTQAFAVLDMLKEKLWKKETLALFEKIRDMLYLHSDFEAAAQAAAQIAAQLTQKEGM